MIILIGGTKGGVGKSTLVTNLAIIDINQGNDAVLVDIDPQGSSVMFTATRDEDDEVKRLPCLVKNGEKTFTKELIELDSKYDNVFVDVGGYDSGSMRSALIVAHKLYIPIQPSQMDIWALPRIIRLIKDAQITKADIAASGGRTPDLDCHFVLNMVSTNPKESDDQDTIEILTQYNLSTSRASIKSRKAFKRAAAAGLSVTELTGADYNPKAVEEIMTLYEEIIHG